MQTIDPTPDTEPNPTKSASSVFVIGLTMLGLATVLNAASILQTAERQDPDSPLRSVGVAVMERVVTLSEWTGLDLPRRWLDAALGRNQDDATPTAVTTTTVPGSPTTTTTTEAPVDSGGSTTTTTGPAESTTTTLAVAQVVTADDPMGMWIIGDSLAKYFGPELANLAFDSGVVDPTVNYRVVSGLVARNYFDWPEYVADRMPDLAPDVVVVLFGGNDHQAIFVDGTRIEEHTPEWMEAYRGRVAEMMDLILSLGAEHIYWVGLPIMGDDEINASVPELNSAYAAEAEERPEVTFVPAYDLFTDESGKYATHLRDEEGELRRMRSADGAHFEPAGARRLAIHVLRYLSVNFDLGVDYGDLVPCPPSC